MTKTAEGTCCLSLQARKAERDQISISTKGGKCEFAAIQRYQNVGGKADLGRCEILRVADDSEFPGIGINDK